MVGLPRKKAPILNPKLFAISSTSPQAVKVVWIDKHLNHATVSSVGARGRVIASLSASIVRFGLFPACPFTSNHSKTQRLF